MKNRRGKVEKFNLDNFNLNSDFLDAALKTKFSCLDEIDKKILGAVFINKKSFKELSKQLNRSITAISSRFYKTIRTIKTTDLVNTRETKLERVNAPTRIRNFLDRLSERLGKPLISLEDLTQVSKYDILNCWRGGPTILRGIKNIIKPLKISLKFENLQIKKRIKHAEIVKKRIISLLKKQKFTQRQAEEMSEVLKNRIKPDSTTPKPHIPN